MCKLGRFQRTLVFKFGIMKSHISCLLEQALKTFVSEPDAFNSNMDQLKSSLNRITHKDVNLNPILTTQRLWQKPDKAPVTYIDIYEDCNLTMGIFVLKPGMKLPLHNHPEMHGLIKVIVGAVKITSFSINTPRTKEVSRSGLLTEESLRERPFVIAECCPDVIADSNSECCVLKPNSKNLHQIEAIEGPAAFIDILSPPYSTRIPGNGIRECRYYELRHEVVPGVVRLEEITAPSWYWTDSYRYEGPKLC